MNGSYLVKVSQFFKKFISIGGLLPALTTTAGQEAIQAFHNSATAVANDAYRKDIDIIFLRNIQQKALDKEYYKFYLRGRFFLVYVVYLVRFLYNLVDLIVGIGSLLANAESIKLRYETGCDSGGKSLFIFTNGKLREQLSFHPSNYQVIDIVISATDGIRFLADDYIALIKLKIINFSVSFVALKKVYIIEKNLGALISDHCDKKDDCALLLREGCGPYQMAISKCFRQAGIKSICYFPSPHIPEHTIFPPATYLLTATDIPVSQLFHDQKLYILEEYFFSDYQSIQAECKLNLKSVCYIPAWGELNDQLQVDSAVIEQLELIFDVVHFRPHPQEFDDSNRVSYFDTLRRIYTHTILSNSKFVPFSDTLKDVCGIIIKVYSTCIVDALMSGRFVIFIGPPDSLKNSISPELNDQIIYVVDDANITDEITQRVKQWVTTKSQSTEPTVSSPRAGPVQFESILNEILTT